MEDRPGTDPGNRNGEIHFLAIVGPTAAGKTGLSLDLAPLLCAEIISMDSRQIYRGMDIGTGKVGLRERAMVPHHGLDLRDPDERYSAGQFARDARRWIREIRGRGRLPLIVGGTGFFLRALMAPLFAEPPLEPARVESLRALLNRMPVDRLVAWAATLDPERDREGVAGDRQRLTRTVEIALLTGRPLSWWHRRSQPQDEPLDGLVILVDLPRDVLYGRINQRVEEMVREGLPGEVDRLLRAGFRRNDPGMTGAGYGEMVDFLEGRSTLSDATEEIRRRHRRYARRQHTWFRHQLPSGAVTLDMQVSREVLVANVVTTWRERNRLAERGKSG